MPLTTGTTIRYVLVDLANGVAPGAYMRKRVNQSLTSNAQARAIH